MARSLLLLMLCAPALSGAGPMGTLREALEPQMIRVFGDRLYVVEDHVIYIYGLPGVQFERKIAREGEGPGEFTLDPSRSLNISVHPEYILAQSRSKYVFFDHKGEMIREGRKLPAILQLYPLEKGFVVLRLTNGDDGRQFFSLNIYDNAMNNVKELHRQKFFTFGDELHPMPDALNFCVIDNRIYVEKSVDGFVIDVYNDAGEKLDRISHDYRKIELTDEAREVALKEVLSIPSIQRMRETRGQSAVTAMLRDTRLTYPEHLPAIENIVAASDKLYVKTFEHTARGDHWLVLTREGRILERIVLPRAQRPPYLVRLQGDKNYYSIHGGYYYYLKSAEYGEEDVWEVHRVKLG